MSTVECLGTNRQSRLQEGALLSAKAGLGIQIKTGPYQLEKPRYSRHFLPITSLTLHTWSMSATLLVTPFRAISRRFWRGWFTKASLNIMARWPKPIENQPTTFGRLSRSELMSRVRGHGNKTTELRLASLMLDARMKGWRRHLSLPGKPDFSWPKLKIALFVDGCFWHGHDCGRNLTPQTNIEEWRGKIKGNRRRDRQVDRELRRRNWSVVRIWECELRKNPRHCLRRIKRIMTIKRNLKGT